MDEDLPTRKVSWFKITDKWYLNEKLKKVLSGKEYKRWSKYSEKKKEALHPKTPSNSSNNSMQQGGMSGGQRGGLGRGQQRRY